MGCQIAPYKLGWLFAVAHAITAALAGPAFMPAPTANPRRLRGDFPKLRGRASTTSYVSTCGYLDGDIDDPRTAQSGYDCRVDTTNNLWGFCPTTVLSASDCGLAAACQDSGSCSDICQYNTNTDLTTFTCESSGTVVNYCSTAILVSNSQSYAYLACGASAETQEYLATPITTTNTSTGASSSTAASASGSETVAVSTSTGTAGNTVIATSTASTASATTSAGSGSTSSVSTGAIVGSVLGGLALVCMSSIAALYILKRNRTETQNPSLPKAPAPSPPAPPMAPVATVAPGTSFASASVGPYYELDSQNKNLKHVFYNADPLELSASGAYVVELPSNPQPQQPS